MKKIIEVMNDCLDACFYMVLALFWGFLWVPCLFLKMTEDGVGITYQREGISCCLLGVSIPLLLVAFFSGITNIPFLMADVFLMVFVIYLTMGLLSSSYFRREYGSSFFPG